MSGILTTTRPQGDPPAAPPPGEPPVPAGKPPRGPGFLTSLLLKTLFMGVLNALGAFALFVSFGAENWGFFAFLLVSLVVADVIYFSKRLVPAKYLFPGLFFLLIFQIFVVAYTVFISFTNFGDAHTINQNQAREQILAVSEQRVPESPAYDLTIVAREGQAAPPAGEDAGAGDAGAVDAPEDPAETAPQEELAFLLTGPDGEVSLGTSEGLQEVDADAVTLDDEGVATAIEGWESLSLGDLADRQQAVVGFRVPLADEEDPDAGSLRTQDGRIAYEFRPQLEYDEEADALVDTRDGTVYTADQSVGFYVGEDGTELTPGWRVPVGVDNYVRVFNDDRLSVLLLGTTVWSFAFAAISVISTFFLGVLLAIVFDNPRMRGRKLYRSLMILPYAAPSFMSMLLWAGFLNPSFGFVNQILLGGADIPWLTDPWLARFSVLLVNLWLGFPYMFLVCTGALQSIPGDVKEAARVDGASAFRIFRSITLPLLMVSVAPLLIASFAFNFNNFTLIYFVTGGGPNIPEASISLGATDLLIHVVYTLGFESGGGQQWGFACALSVLIFFIVAGISAVSFRQTRALEDIN
ncbi:ABC transporter permease subunit [Aquipuribacter nitratireducens]|uniref:Maltose/maltodextrin transport system permease protein n=1 Tax=Aquipuribacter nitratireducens TaxID=650104 RepID=A0ABW0GLP5_9MICO